MFSKLLSLVLTTKTTSVHIIGFFGGWQEFTKFLVMEQFNFGICPKKTNHILLAMFSNTQNEISFYTIILNRNYIYIHIY